MKEIFLQYRKDRPVGSGRSHPGWKLVEGIFFTCIFFVTKDAWDAQITAPPSVCCVTCP